MSGTTYYERNKDVILNRAKDYYMFVLLLIFKR